MEYKKNSQVEIEITDTGVSGEGIGKIDGFTLFVKDAVQGDKVLALLTKVKKNYAYARCEKVLVPSPFRIEPRCPIYKPCGGCQMPNSFRSSSRKYLAICSASVALRQKRSKA